MRVTGWPAVVLFVAYIAFFIWSIYLMIKIAAHVGAWPFG